MYYISYGDGHDMQICCRDHHCEEQYGLRDSNFYERVIHCCIKDIEELNHHGWSHHVSLTAKAIQGAYKTAHNRIQDWL